MIYTARVFKIKGTTVHRTLNEDLTHRVCRIEIHEEGRGMFFTYRFDKHDRCVADTVDFSLAEARSQADHEYDLEWETEPPPAAVVDITT